MPHERAAAGFATAVTIDLSTGSKLYNGNYAAYICGIMAMPMAGADLGRAKPANCPILVGPHISNLLVVHYLLTMSFSSRPPVYSGDQAT